VNASTHQFYPIPASTLIRQKNLLAVYVVTCTSQVRQVLGSLARTGEFGEFSKYGKGILDHFIYAKYVLLYIK
jgi:hypothetical protein